MINNSDNIKPTIGIYSIFIDTYILFYKNFIKNMEYNFLPQYKKYYYIVTDKLDIDVYNDRTYLLYADKIGWPYETLYRYKYYLLFNKDYRNKSTYTYFLNANASCVDIIDNNILPDLNNYVFTIHDTYVNKPYEQCTFENNPLSTAFFSNNNNKYIYYGGRFFGALTEQFEYLCITLNNNIDIDESNGIIARWHDESHLNHFCNYILKNKFKKLGIEYHVQNINTNTNKKIIYLDKYKYLPNMLKNNAISITNGKIIINKYNKTINFHYNQ